MGAEPFLDNWSYLKVELNWLERLLLTAVAKQRKETKALDRVSQTKADQVTSHWWKGVISLEEPIASDSPADRKKSTPTISYQQQLEARIQASWHKGIGLSLPMICDRLELTPFEKNAILIALAPEVHRRYAQLYGYLQSGQDVQERPTIDLVLRLLCRTDAEWRIARSSLLPMGKLQESGLLEVEGRSLFLTRSLKLSDQFVNYLLAESGDLAELEELLEPQVSNVFARSIPRTPIELVLPEPVLDQLDQICDQIQFAPQLKAWGFKQSSSVNALLIGASGTGKTLSVQWIAQQLEMPLTEIDLAIVDSPIDLIEDLIAEAPMILSIKSAERWLTRSAPIGKVIELIDSRRSLTCFSVSHRIAIPARLRSRLQFTIELPKPDPSARLQLWKQAFPKETPIAEFDWQVLAKKHSLTGGEIKAIAKAAAIEAIAQNAEEIELQHILKALSSGH